MASTTTEYGITANYHLKTTTSTYLRTEEHTIEYGTGLMKKDKSITVRKYMIRPDQNVTILTNKM